MTSIQNNPVANAFVNAVAKEVVSSLMNFAKMQLTAVGVDQTMMSRCCNRPIPVRCGTPVGFGGGQGIAAGNGGCLPDWDIPADRLRPRLPDCTMPPWCQPKADPITVTSPVKNGKAEIDLGDGYTMQLREKSSEIVITDPNGDKTRIWGDPHVDVNGKRVGDFYDTTTFELKNGTKITINTEPWVKGGNGTYVASQVVVTRGDQGMIIDGISQNELGDLKITQGYDGQALDFAHDDGFNLTEAGDKDTYGWNSEFTGERVTTAEMKEMTLHENREMREGMERMRDVGNAFASWLFLGNLGAVVSLANSESFERDVRTDLQERPVYAFLAGLMGVGR